LKGQRRVKLWQSFHANSAFSRKDLVIAALSRIVVADSLLKIVHLIELLSWERSLI